MAIATEKHDLIRELYGKACVCGNQKRSKETFCWWCYRTLPKDQQRALYRFVGEGYEEAYAAAYQTLVNSGRIQPRD